MSDKFDLSKQRKDLYRASATKPAIIDVPKLKYLMIDGAGYPDMSAEFQPAMEALYGIAYTLKFAGKADGHDFKVMGPEGIWWMDGDVAFDAKNPNAWRWTLISSVPDFIDARAFRAARKALAEKGKGGPSLDNVRLKAWKEGRVVQILHIGPYNQEGPTIAALHAFAASEGLQLHGRHHEIHLSDPRRVAPEKLKTILRHPVK
jgi:hypothetical protein